MNKLNLVKVVNDSGLMGPWPNAILSIFQVLIGCHVILNLLFHRDLGDLATLIASLFFTYFSVAFAYRIKRRARHGEQALSSDGKELEDE